jgi:hypothetical protein
MHVIATNLCVWIRTFIKECTKEVTRYRVDMATGVSEDYMILGTIFCLYVERGQYDKISNFKGG